MKVHEIMTRDVKYINKSQPIISAAEMMRDGNFGSLLVEENNRLAGMITDRDLALRVIAQGKNPRDMKVEDCMTDGIEYCFEDDNIAEVSTKMSETRYRRLPVLDKNKDLVGIVSLGDLAQGEESKSVTHEALKQICH